MMKLLPLCTLAVCLPWLAASQSNNLANTAFYLQTQVEQGFLLCPSGSGTLYALANDGIDMVLMEFGAEGDILSSRYMNIGVFGLDVPADMFVDSDGKLVITGNFQEDSPGNGFVLRYDPLLRKVLWAKTFLGDATLVYGVLEVGPGGNFLVCTNPHKANSDDAEFLQLDRATGQRVPGSAWRYDVGASDQFVLTLHQGDLYAIGRFSDGNGPVSQPFMRNALLKINLTTGQPVWTRLGHIAPNVEARLYGRDLVVDQDAIISTHSGNDLGAQLNRSQIFLQKTTLDGELVWLKKIDLSEFATEFAEELVSVPDGYVLYGRPLANTENALFVLKTDKNGEVLWARKFQGPGRNRMIAAAQNQLATIGNEMYATGTSEAGGITNMFLLKISADGKISDDCPAFVPTPATFTEVLNPAHYSVNPTVTASLTGIPDLAAAPSVPFFPEKEVLCQQIIGNNCQDMVDWTFTIDGFSCDAGSLSLSYTLCNSGGIAASGPVPVSFYLGNPTFGPATPLGTYALNGTLAPGECQVGALGNLSDLWFPNGLNGLHLIYGVVNDDASWAPPFSLDTFPPTGLEECDYANNLSFSAILADTPGPDLGPDQIVCQDSSATFDAGAGYFSYLWSDGSNGQTLTVSTPGEYWVETIDFCGFRRRDTV
ncbi:MAG: hypothetical protein JNK89_07120, partial [Saprospiraceae bacterium]|nr:hypothetical protein [Saprospiraceae bacterium]